MYKKAIKIVYNAKKTHRSYHVVATVIKSEYRKLSNVSRAQTYCQRDLPIHLKADHVDNVFEHETHWEGSYTQTLLSPQPRGRNGVLFLHSILFLWPFCTGTPAFIY